MNSYVRHCLRIVVCAGFVFWQFEVRPAPAAEPPAESLPVPADRGDYPTLVFETPDDSSAEPGQEAAPSTESEFSQRFDELERKFEALSTRNEELQSSYDDLRSELERSVTVGTDDSTIQVSGRIHADHWAFPGDSPGANAFESGDPAITPQDRIGFRRVRLGVAGDIWRNMVYKIEMEFAEGNESEFRDVYLGFSDLPLLQTVLIGNQKRPYGLDHLNSSRYNVFIERPFIVESFNQDARRLGIVSYGVSEDEAWNWRYGVYNQRLIQGEGNYISDHYQAELAGRLANTIWYDECSGGRGYAHWALSGTLAKPDGSNNGAAPPPNPWGRADNTARFRTRPEARTESRWLDTGVILGADQYQLLGLEGVVNLGPCQLVAEYQNLWMQRDTGSELHFHGGYAYVSYFLTGEHVPWDRTSGTLGRVEPFENFFLTERCYGRRGQGWGAWQLALRWSYADLSDDDILGGIGDSVTCGLNWHWNPNAQLQFNYIHGNIYDHEPVAGQAFGDYHILGTRFLIDY